jgi:hypothetical protein
MPDRQPEDTCEAIRSFASTKLQLSTLDALLVRWAAVKYGNLDKALADPARARAIAHAVSTSTGSPTKVETIEFACWNDEDQKTLAGVLSAMGAGGCPRSATPASQTDEGFAAQMPHG